MKRYRVYKKGQVEYLPQNAFRIGFAIVALLCFFLLINYYVINKADTQKLRSEVLFNRILYSDTIMYSDNDIFRTYHGIVDLKKLNNENVDSGINFGQYSRHASAKIKILDKKNVFIKDAYLNKENYDKLKVLVNAGTTGKGSATMFIREYPVTYIGIDNRKYYGTLIVELILPNS